MAAPGPRVYVLVGDGSYLMMSQEIVDRRTGAARHHIVLIDNHGFASIGGLSESGRQSGFRHALPRAQSGERIPSLR